MGKNPTKKRIYIYMYIYIYTFVLLSGTIQESRHVAPKSDPLAGGVLSTKHGFGFVTLGHWLRLGFFRRPKREDLFMVMSTSNYCSGDLHGTQGGPRGGSSKNGCST